jgi:hypothetical protein
MKTIFVVLVLIANTNAFANNPPTISGKIKGFVAKDALAPEVVRTTITGELAKAIFNHLNVESYILSGQDGEQTTKDATGVTCGHFSGTKYFCAVDFASQGVN